MLKPKLRIEQCDDGWILRYTGRNALDQVKVCKKWEDVLKILDDYFGWWSIDGKFRKIPR